MMEGHIAVGTAELVLSSLKQQPQTDVLQIKIPAQSSVTFKKADSGKNSYEGNQEKKT